MKLSKPQRAAVMRAEPTLYGEEKIAVCHGRTASKLVALGLATGAVPHLYLTDAGKEMLHGKDE
jgi:hypothetical protein